MKTTLPLLTPILVFPILPPAASAEVVWSDDTFPHTGSGNNTVLTTDFTGANGPDWDLTNSTDDNAFITVVSNSLKLDDGSVGSQGRSTSAVVRMDQFASFTLGPTTPILRLRYDMKVTELSINTGQPSWWKDNHRNWLAFAGADNQVLYTGFGLGTVNDGDASDEDLVLYAQVRTGGETLVTPDNDNAIGLNPGSGWDAGFDFGNYDSVTTRNDTHDQWYRFDVTYNYNTGAVAGTVTNLATLASTTFSRTMDAELAFSNSSAHTIGFSAGNTCATDAYIDNIVVEVISEQGTMPRITDCGMVDADTFFIEFSPGGTGYKVTSAADLDFTNSTDVVPTLAPTVPGENRFEFDVSGPLGFFRVEAD